MTSADSGDGDPAAGGSFMDGRGPAPQAAQLPRLVLLLFIKERSESTKLHLIDVNQPAKMLPAVALLR